MRMIGDYRRPYGLKTSRKKKNQWRKRHHAEYLELSLDNGYILRSEIQPEGKYKERVIVAELPMMKGLIRVRARVRHT